MLWKKNLFAFVWFFCCCNSVLAWWNSSFDFAHLHHQFIILAFLHSFSIYIYIKNHSALASRWARLCGSDWELIKTMLALLGEKKMNPTAGGSMKLVVFSISRCYRGQCCELIGFRSPNTCFIVSRARANWHQYNWGKKQSSQTSWTKLILCVRNGAQKNFYKRCDNQTKN